MYREMAGTDERVRAIPGVRDRRVRATKVRLYISRINSKTSKVNQQSVLNLDRTITFTSVTLKIHRQNLKYIIFFNETNT